MAAKQERGAVWEEVRRLYIAEPFLPVKDIAKALGVSDARVHACRVGLEKEHTAARKHSLETNENLKAARERVRKEKTEQLHKVVQSLK